MRTYQDAKAMAKSLRDCLAARSVRLSHAECLEIVAKQAGCADWNTLCAMLDVASRRPMPATAEPEQVSCSFCKKSQHEVRSLIEGGCSRDRIGTHRGCFFICDECVAFCAQVNADLIGGATTSESLSAFRVAPLGPHQ
jgi:hypothetical protein